MLGTSISNIWVLVWLRGTKNGEKPKFCYINTHSFIVYIESEDISVDIAKDVEIRFNTSNYKLEWPWSLPKGKS